MSIVFQSFGLSEDVCQTGIIQPKKNGSNTFGTMKRCWRQGLFEPMGVNRSARIGGIIRIFFQFYFNKKVCCVFSLDLPHLIASSNRLDEAILMSTHNIPISIRKSPEIIPTTIMSAAMGFLAHLSTKCTW